MEFQIHCYSVSPISFKYISYWSGDCQLWICHQVLQREGEKIVLVMHSYRHLWYIFNLIISLIGPYHKSENKCKDTCPESGQAKQIEVNAISSHSLMCTWIQGGVYMSNSQYDREHLTLTNRTRECISSCGYANCKHFQRSVAKWVKWGYWSVGCVDWENIILSFSIESYLIFMRSPSCYWQYDSHRSRNYLTQCHKQNILSISLYSLHPP